VSGREEVLARIRTALRDRPAAPQVPRNYHTAEHALADAPIADAPATDVPPDASPQTGQAPAGQTPAGLADLLVDRITDYRATVRRCAAPELPATVAAALRDRNAGRVVVPADLDSAWLAAAAAIDFVTDDPPLTPADLDAVDGVLTTCAVAIAETGTIVLDAGTGQGRRAITLVPDYHLVVVLPDSVVPSVPAAVARLDPVRPLTWISGPSATSDIELDRVEGVHGPRTLEVVLVDGA
jgi:L-lactate dehydrogenase complex protein LldG